MSNTINILSDVTLAGALSFGKNYTDFPINPAPRTLVVMGGIPYIYTELVNGSGFFTWQPIGIKQASFLHTQGVASTTWTVSHNFNTNDFAYFVYDNNHNLVIANINIIDQNTCQILLTQAMTGTVVLFSLQYLNATTLEATQQVNIGTLALTDHTGVLSVNGNDIAFVANVTAEATARTAADAVLETKIDNIINNVDPAILNSLAEMIVDFQSADGSLSSSITTLGTSSASALSAESTTARAAETALSTRITTEVSRAESAESLLAPIATTYTKTQVDSAISGATHSFSALTSKPTTIAGYGITDAMTVSAVITTVNAAVAGATPSYSSITGKPTTILGYGISDAATAASVTTEILRASKAEYDISMDIISRGNLFDARLDVLQGWIGLEETTRLIAEATFAPQISTYTKGEVDTLRNSAATQNGALINAERVRAIAAESVLAPQATTYTKNETDAAIQAVIGAAPDALNTLSSIAIQLASDESAAAALVTTVSGKASQATTYTKIEVDSLISSSTPSFSTLTGKPTTVAGYGITDAISSANVVAAVLVESNRAEAAEHALDVTHSADIATLTATVNTKASLASPSFSGSVTGITKSMVGLANVDNTSDANKPVSGATVTAIAVETNRAETSEGTLLVSLTAETNRALAAETLLAPISYVNSQIGLLSFSGSLSSNFAVNSLTVSGDIMPAISGVSNIGSPTDKFAAIYTKELHIDANTLYVDGVPVIGSSANTIQITADVNQGLALSTTGTGQTILNSQTATVIQTNGVNADVNIQTAGVGSMVRMTSVNGVVITSPLVNIQGSQSISSDLTVAGNLTVNGTTTAVNSTNMSVKDNIVTINKGELGSGVSLRYAGIEVDRGDLARQRLIWDETLGKWIAGATSQEVALATEPFVTSAISTATASVTTSTLGLGNVSNTSDVAKPVSTAQAAAIALKANASDLTSETAARIAADLLAAPQVSTYTKTQVDTAIASATPSFATLTGKPTSIAGYGITDAVTSAMVNGAVSTETTRANAAEGILTTNLASEVSNRTAAITAEVSARDAAINVETTRATSAESTLTAAVTSKANQATTYTKTEVDAAIAAAITAFALTLYV